MDVDDGTDPQAIHERLTALGVEHVIHSTHSSTSEHPRFRVAVPLAEPVSAADWSRRFRATCAYLTGGHTDTGTSDPARIYYLPSARPGGQTFSYAAHGRALRSMDIPEAPDTASGRTDARLPPTFELDDEDRIPHGRHHEFIVSVSASIAARTPSITKGQLVASVRASCASLFDDLSSHEQEIAQAARSALAKFGRPAPAEPADEITAEAGAGRSRSSGPSVATRLVRAARDRAFLFHDGAGECYATIRVGSHQETYRVRSTAIRRWLGKILFEENASAAPSDALASAILSLEAAAQYDGPQIGTQLRVAEHGADLWIDLGDPEWRAVRVTRDGWTVEAKAPVRFIRGRTTGAFPEPVRGGSLADLAPFLNASATTDRQFVLGVGWVLGAFHPRGPYAVLFIHGEQGAGKSFGSRLLRRLADPASNELRSLPRNEHDLAVAARSSWVLAFDNASEIRGYLSDAICRLSTGGGFATRQLYTDGEEEVFDGKRPVLVNGIPVLAEAADLRDRALVVEWPEPSVKRKEEELAPEFEAALPRLFGAVLDALVLAVRNRASMNPRADLRMLDVAAWVMAAEPSLPWPEGTFAATYADSRAGLAAEAVASSPLAEAIRTLAAAGPWEGTASQLLPELARRANPPIDAVKPIPHGWPKSPKVLGDHLRRLVTDLRAVGVAVIFRGGGKRGRERYISISAAPESAGKTASAASAPSATGEDSHLRKLEACVGTGVGASAATAASTSDAYAADSADAAVPQPSGPDPEDPFEGRTTRTDPLRKRGDGG